MSETSLNTKIKWKLGTHDLNLKFDMLNCYTITNSEYRLNEIYF